MLHLIFIHMLLLSEGQAGEAWESLKELCFGTGGGGGEALGMKEGYFHLIYERLLSNRCTLYVENVYVVLFTSKEYLCGIIYLKRIFLWRYLLKEIISVVLFTSAGCCRH